MNPTGRRTFLQGTALGTAALALGAPPAAAADRRKVVLGVIGTGGMGTNHLRSLAARNDVEIAYVCDVDGDRLAAAAKLVEDGAKKAPGAVKDLRQVLDDKGVDAVLIATPDHWHTPAAILALDVGKHVYVEKPCSHNIREGRLLADAVERSGKLLQVGTQSRSAPAVQEAMDRLKAGDIGEILVAKAWNSQLRRTIGKTKPGDPPKPLDFDLWVGPAPMVPYRANLLPGVWRQARLRPRRHRQRRRHDLDVARGLAATTHPTRVTCLGAVLLRRRPAVARHAVRGLRVPRGREAARER
ncbi:MAG: Gfo/Idh/MocA family oxidoreductase [Singulisphaera sp.]